MTEHTPHRDERPSLSSQDASRMLALGMEGRRAHIHDLVERLDRPGRNEEFRTLLQRIAYDGAEELLRHARPDLEELARMKERCKQQVRAATATDDRLAGTAGYLLAVAGAKVHHDELISGLAVEDVRSMILDLATVAPEPFSDLLARGAYAMEI